MTLASLLRFIITSVYGAALLVLYTYVVIIIIAHKKSESSFRSSFYKLFIVGFFMNMMTYFNSLISLRLPQSNGINETLSNFFLTHNEHNMEVIFPVKVFHFLHYYFAYAQYIYNFFISLNRFSLITNPIKSELFWRKRFWWFVFAIFAIPWAFAVPILVGRSYYVYHSHGDYFFLDTTIKRSLIYTILAPTLSVITAMNSFLNFMSVRKVIILKLSGGRVPEKNLLQMSFVIFFIDIFLVILTLIKAIIIACGLSFKSESTDEILSWIVILIPFASDALTLTQPLLLLFFSKTVRRCCIWPFPCLKSLRSHRLIARNSVLVVRPFGAPTITG
ncbi:Serpentine receptor class gamma [Caenorhabditis elegans]|uniref:Serpentine receptor class gamma n=1 Tax=Caenorhabditis elegans TaxID=6239 RepID=G5EEF5_CAEEL|nr:Serpentine receptor class gamma [Caenorhabditis elegans]CAA94216.1 Serpentine receptor class gamma [Caenorhabditis elegans]|eukprot:NP_510370.1 Serpentine receptor class gamma [Caenorhabditis elegans]